MQTTALLPRSCGGGAVAVSRGELDGRPRRRRTRAAVQKPALATPISANGTIVPGHLVTAGNSSQGLLSAAGYGARERRIAKQKPGAEPAAEKGVNGRGVRSWRC